MACPLFVDHQAVVARRVRETIATVLLTLDAPHCLTLRSGAASRRRRSRCTLLRCVDQHRRSRAPSRRVPQALAVSKAHDDRWIPAVQAIWRCCSTRSTARRPPAPGVTTSTAPAGRGSDIGANTDAATTPRPAARPARHRSSTTIRLSRRHHLRCGAPDRTRRRRRRGSRSRTTPALTNGFQLRRRARQPCCSSLRQPRRHANSFYCIHFFPRATARRELVRDAPGHGAAAGAQRLGRLGSATPRMVPVRRNTEGKLAIRPVGCTIRQPQARCLRRRIDVVVSASVCR